jgi:ATP-dependent phosphoenolpyruvate carboxykinase
MSQLLTVHDPRGYAPQVTGKRLAPRLPTLEGQTVHLVDCLFDNSELFMQQLQAWFAEHLPGVRTEIVKPRESWVDDPALRARVVREAEAAILAVGL